MAGPLNNTCQYSECRKKFDTLRDLIIHIENEHLDFEPKTIEFLELQKPDMIPMSYVLKFGGPGDVAHETKSEIKQDLDVNDNNQHFKHPSVGSSSSVVLNLEKPFVCNVPGCSKKYKNVNGIKYHYTTYHKKAPPNFRGGQHKNIASKRKCFHKIKSDNGYELMGETPGEFSIYDMPTSSEQVPFDDSLRFCNFSVVAMEGYDSQTCDLYQNDLIMLRKQN